MAAIPHRCSTFSTRVRSRRVRSCNESVLRRSSEPPVSSFSRASISAARSALIASACSLFALTRAVRSASVMSAQASSISRMRVWSCEERKRGGDEESQQQSPGSCNLLALRLCRHATYLLVSAVTLEDGVEVIVAILLLGGGVEGGGRGAVLALEGSAGLG